MENINSYFDLHTKQTRPISLLTTICKVVEKVIYNRIMIEVEELNLIPNHQIRLKGKVLYYPTANSYNQREYFKISIAF